MQLLPTCIANGWFSLATGRAWAGLVSSHYLALLRVVAKWGLRSHLRLGTEIVEARFDSSAGTWTLTSDADETRPGCLICRNRGFQSDTRTRLNRD